MARLEGYLWPDRRDGQEHLRELIVLPGRVVANRWRKDGHALVPEDLAGDPARTAAALHLTC